VNHTIYMPLHAPHESLPVLLWAQGGCDNNGTKAAPFLTNIASYGFLVVANGPINGSGDTTPQWLVDSLSWLEKNAGRVGKYKRVDNKKIAAAGTSCGGVEAYSTRNDPRVSLLGIFKSGLLDEVPADQTGVPEIPPSAINEVRVPTFYFLGGPNDVAYPQVRPLDKASPFLADDGLQGARDYASLSGVPKWIGNWPPAGHGGTFREPNGGADGVAAVNWLTGIFKGNKEARKFFLEGSAEAAGWNETQSYGLGKLLA
jgi:hypothetical protein